MHAWPPHMRPPHLDAQLTLWHMVVCTTLASICVLSGVVKPLEIPQELYLKKIIPIAACYAGALWTSNAAYAISSVSFAQVGD